MQIITDNINSFCYEATGNRFLIVPLFLTKWEGVSAENIRQNDKLSSWLLNLAKPSDTDSCLVLSGDLTNGGTPKMFIFEHQGKSKTGQHGTWSTMCGNGIRAICQFFLDRNWGNQDEKGNFLLETLSGPLKVRSRSGNFQVEMGEVTFESHDLEFYISPRTFPNRLFNINLPGYKQLPNASIGFTGHRNEGGKIDGEPHLIMETSPNISLKELETLTTAYGKKITNDKEIFPGEMNTDVYSLVRHDKTKKKFVVNMCTYERGVYYVTASCGTGSTITGATIFEKENLDEEYTVIVQNKGGTLNITTRNGIYFMEGSANKI